MTKDERALLWVLGGLALLGAVTRAKQAYDEFKGDPVADPDDPRRFGSTRMRDMHNPGIKVTPRD